MKSLGARIATLTVTFCSALLVTGATAHAQNCAPGVARSILASPVYLHLLSTLVPVEKDLEELLQHVRADTAEPDDPTNQSDSGNSYAHFQAKTVNENHNTRVAI